MRSSLNQDELWLFLLEGVLYYWKESGFNPLTEGKLDLFDELSLFLSWELKLDFAKWWLGHCKGLVGTKGIFLDSSFSNKVVPLRYLYW